jgi:3-oxoacyl-[acyl-carrier protein] reductase
METKFKRRALVCAASAGLGWAIAKRLLQNGRRVTLVSRDEKRLSDARDRLLRDVPQAPAEEVDFIAADLSTAAGIDQLWQAQASQPPVDILVTNIGGPPQGTIFDHSDETWHRQFDAIFLSVVRLMRLTLPSMRQRQWGRIVCVTSVSCKEPIPGLLVSNALRAGVAALVSTVAKEEARHGIAINNLCPGMTDTERLGEIFEGRAARSGRSVEQERAASLAMMPRGRFNTPDEFAAVAAFLTSEDASGISGASVSVDGASGRFIFG